MTNWIKYTGTQEQNNEMNIAKHGVIVRFEDGNIRTVWHRIERCYEEPITHYLICERNPHLDMIVEWANTGRPVEFEACHGKWVAGEHLTWSRDVNYRFAEPEEEKKHMEFRAFLFKRSDGSGLMSVNVVVKGMFMAAPEFIESTDTFVEWIDKDRRKVEI